MNNKVCLRLLLYNILLRNVSRNGKNCTCFKNYYIFQTHQLIYIPERVCGHTDGV